MKTSFKLLAVLLTGITLFTGCNSGSSTTTPAVDTECDSTLATPVQDDATTTQTAKAGFTGYYDGDGNLSAYTAPEFINGEGKKLMAIYMVGSNLESDGEAGTSDLNELIAGYNTLSETEKNNLDIVIAFGGSNKDGWRGMRIADIAMIIEDSQDGIYGNLDEYLHTSPLAHMGDDSSLELFLQYLKDGYGEHEQKFITLWDHGSAYGSFGNDDNYDGDGLTMEEMDSALSAVDLWFNVLGYDACLNGNFELASMIKKHADYLVGSEELEPGHGWNYTAVLPAFVKNSDMTVFGTEIVKNYVKHSSHPYESEGKTLAMVDLSQYDALETAVDALATYANENLSNEEIKKSVIQSASKAQQYGKSSREDSAITIDLKGFAQGVAKTQNDAPTAAVLTALNNYVVYASQDGTRPNSNGVSIVPPVGHDEYDENVAPSPGWYAMTRSMQSIISNDTSAPTVGAENAQTQITQSDFQDEDAEALVESFYAGLQSEIATLLSTDWADLSQDDKIWNLEDYWYEKEDGFWNQNNTPQVHNIITNCADSEAAVCQNMSIPSLASAAAKRMAVNKRSSLLGALANYTTVEKKVLTNRATNKASTQDVITGTRATFHDDNLQNVRTIYGNILTEDGVEKFASIAVLEALKTNNADEYFTPTWNQQWYIMSYGNCEGDNTWIPMEFDSEYRSRGAWFRVFSAEIDYADAKKDYSDYPVDERFDYAKLYVTIDEVGNVVSNSVRPYRMVFESESDTQGTILYDKASQALKVGDKITLYARYFNLETYEEEWAYESDTLTIAKAPTFTLEQLVFVDDAEKELDYYYMMIGTDISGNWVTTEPAKAGAIPTN
jgi:hypothetical protein